MLHVSLQCTKMSSDTGVIAVNVPDTSKAVRRERSGDPLTSALSGTSNTIDGGLQNHHIPTPADMVVLGIHFKQPFGISFVTR